jgi:glycosyltransferase involved in cell wall biosynthesis
VNRLKSLKGFQGGFRGTIKKSWKAGKINFSNLYVRHFGKVPYFDVETGKTVDLRTFLSPDSRKHGISGFMRLRNEAQFVETAIESVIGGLDELVIVYNGCTDRTSEIIESCRLRHPDRIRVFEYQPEIARPGSVEHQRTPMGSPHSMVNYYNFALVKTTRKVAIKIDGDDCYLKEPFRQLTGEIRAEKRSMPIGVSGINLWDEKGEIFVNSRHPILSGVDRGFFTVTPQTFFVHYPLYELFTYAFGRSAGICYYHLKGLKEDRGLGNYVTRTGETRFSTRKIRSLRSPDLMSWKDFHTLMGSPEELPNPAVLGLRATVRSEHA